MMVAVTDKADEPTLQPWSAALYSTIEDWWGEEVSPSMVKKVAAAPKYQIRKFLNDVAAQDFLNFSPVLPAMARGTLRPLVSANPIEAVPNDDVSVALRILLYSQEVALECDFIGDVFQESTGAVAEWEHELTVDVLGKLAALRPLVHQGIVHFTSVRSRAIHPASSLWQYRALKKPEIRELVLQLVNEHETLTGSRFAEDEVTETLLAFFLVNFYGAIKIGLQRMSDGTANPLTRSEADRVLVNALFAGGLSPDRRLLRLDTLARLPVPDFRSDPKLLVGLRDSDEHFGSWREKLGRALDLIGEMPDSGNLDEASDIVRTELESALPGLRKAVDRSPALRAAENGVVQFGVGAVGAASAAIVVTGSPIAGIVSGATTQALSGIVSYFKERRGKKADRLKLALAASFDTFA
jgi:hypothetical protein